MAKADRPSPEIRVILMPRDTNVHGTIFGGVILSYLDLAAAAAARRLAHHNFVTVAMNAVEFLAPVFVGDVVSFYCEVTRVGRTSITSHVWVEAERHANPGEIVRVTEADIVYVAVDEKRRPITIVPRAGAKPVRRPRGHQKRARA
jgi:acyl-CoA thioesterase YciA